MRLIETPKRPFRHFGGRIPIASARIQSVVALGLDETAVKRWIRARHHEVRHCYTDALAILHGGVAGELTLAWAIDSRGRIRSPQLVDATVDLTDVGNCILTKLSRGRFPPMRGQAKVKITFRFTP